MTPEADLDPGAKLFARTVHIMPTPSAWPTIGRLALEFFAIIVAGTVLFVGLAMLVQP